MKKETRQNPPPFATRLFRVGGPHALQTAPSPTRIARFAARVTIQEAAQAAGVSLSRASLLERGLRDDPQALAALDAAIERIAAERRAS